MEILWCRWVRFSLSCTHLIGRYFYLQAAFQQHLPLGNPRMDSSMGEHKLGEPTHTEFQGNIDDTLSMRMESIPERGEGEGKN